jgi:selenocysteine lyase/cysteine desulfurase
MDLQRVRALFSVPRERAYLDTATYGPTPRPVAEALSACVAAAAEGSGDWRVWEADGERARASFARLLGVRPESIALVPSVSGAAAQVASGLEAGRVPGNVVVGEGEFRSNLFPWMALERRGLEVRLVPFQTGRIPAERLLAAVDARTELVAVSHVQSASGYRVDLAQLARRCRERGVRLFVDATQSAGALSIPLDGVDYLATAAYKWLLAPRGTAFLYVEPRHVPEMDALAPGWKSVEDPYAGYYGPPLALAPAASRFDFSLAWPLWAGAARALELVLEAGIAEIEARDLELARLLRVGLSALGRTLLYGEDEGSQIVSVSIDRPDAVRAALRRAGVVAAVRQEWLRLSPHFFNDEEDVERLLDALRRA